MYYFLQMFFFSVGKNSFDRVKPIGALLVHKNRWGFDKKMDFLSYNWRKFVEFFCLISVSRRIYFWGDGIGGIDLGISRYKTLKFWDFMTHLL